MVEPSSSGKNCLKLTGPFRTESDLLGERQVPKEAYYGIQTLRAVENYDISGVRLRHFPKFTIACAQVKKACAIANHELGHLPTDMKEAICRACDELIDPEATANNAPGGGKGQGDIMRQSFVVDMVQGGAGTSTNMNANEVIANRALELMGFEKGDYAKCHPNDHINKSQSTNDFYPTAAKVAIHHMHHDLVDAMRKLRDAFADKAKEFARVVKMGRTQLQDAVPMTLGQEFNSYATTLKRDYPSVQDAASRFLECNLGGTAIGTGIAADPRFSAAAVKALSKVTGLEIRLADDLINASSSVSAMIFFSGMLRRVGIEVSKICNDLRLLSSGPRCGFNEINLPAMAPGSSIMPGKVNPVIPEVMTMCAYQVVGYDATVVMGAEAGQLELNVFEPVIIHSLVMSVQVLTRGMNTLREKCVVGITANEERCGELVHNSIGIVTVLLPHIGYKKASLAAKTALKENRSVVDIVVEMGCMEKAALMELLDPVAMTGNGSQEEVVSAAKTDGKGMGDRVRSWPENSAEMGMWRSATEGGYPSKIDDEEDA